MFIGKQRAKETVNREQKNESEKNKKKMQKNKNNLRDVVKIEMATSIVSLFPGYPHQPNSTHMLCFFFGQTIRNASG